MHSTANYSCTDLPSDISVLADTLLVPQVMCCRPLNTHLCCRLLQDSAIFSSAVQHSELHNGHPVHLRPGLGRGWCSASYLPVAVCGGGCDAVPAAAQARPQLCAHAPHPLHQRRCPPALGAPLPSCTAPHEHLLRSGVLINRSHCTITCLAVCVLIHSTLLHSIVIICGWRYRCVVVLGDK